MLLIKALAALAIVAVEKAAATIFYAGVAESSGEFGVWSMCTSFFPDLFKILLLEQWSMETRTQ